MSLVGYMGKILIVHLTENRFEEVTLDESIYRQYIGGYGLGVRVLYERMKPKADPLGPDNWLGFLAGPFVGTTAPSSGRFICVGKSPLTGGWGDANCGGSFGPMLLRTGYDGVFFTGKSSKPVYLWLTDKSKELRDAGHLWGKDSFETEDIIKKEFSGINVKVACIGQAGETRSKIAGIMHDYGRAAGRSGLGAVMGSKNLKAIVVNGSIKAEIASPEELKEITRACMRELKKEPIPPAKLFNNQGTPGLYVGAVASQDAPIKNWKGIVGVDYSIEQANKLSGDVWNNNKVKAYACAQCPIACGAEVEMKDPYRNETVLSSRPEYETIAGFGSLCLVDDAEKVFKANDLCNRYGFDTISASHVVSFAMECYENAILNETDTGGFPLIWGDPDAAIILLELMVKREGIGDILADGVFKASKKIGKGSEEYAIHTGRSEPGLHDFRFKPAYAYGAEWDASSGRHTQGALASAQMGVYYLDLEPYKINERLSEEKYNYDYEITGKAHAISSSWTHFLDSAGACRIGWSTFRRFPATEMMKAITGWKDFDVKEAVTAGERIGALRWYFNLREGITPDDVKAHRRTIGNPPLQSGPLQGVTIDMEKMRKFYFKHVGWDNTALKFTDEKITELGLAELVK